jgi:putative N-acetylmannosamine-6-phosphate epimerase
MAVAEERFLLDTGAWVAVRRQRLRERAILWGFAAVALAAVAALTIGGAMGVRAVAAADLSAAVPTSVPLIGSEEAAAEAPPAVVAPPVADTPVAVWNGLGAQGVAAETARRLTLENYPIAAVGDAPTRGYERTYVMYQATDPEGEAAAGQVIETLGLKHAVAQPMDGVAAEDIGSARLLVIIADPLRDD